MTGRGFSALQDSAPPSLGVKHWPFRHAAKAWGVFCYCFWDRQPSAHKFIPQQEYAQRCLCKRCFSQFLWMWCWSSQVWFLASLQFSYNCREIPDQLYAKLDPCKRHLSRFWHWISGKSLSSKCTNSGDKSCIFVLVACCCVSLDCRSCACLRFWVLMCQFFDVGKAS